MRRLMVLILPLFAACAPAAQTAGDGSAPAARPAVAASTAGILGDYTVTLSASDFPSTTQEQVRGRSVGSWEIAFHPGNHFVGKHNGRQVIEGPYQVSGNRISFSTGESGPYACNTPATYIWQMDDGRLTFIGVGTDACPGRVLALTSRPLARTP